MQIDTQEWMPKMNASTLCQNDMKEVTLKSMLYFADFHSDLLKQGDGDTENEADDGKTKIGFEEIQGAQTLLSGNVRSMNMLGRSGALGQGMYTWRHD